MAYAYSFMVQTAPTGPAIDEATPDEVSQGLALALTPLGASIATALQEYPGGPGEVVSHSISVLGPHLVVTFLVRQETP